MKKLILTVAMIVTQLYGWEINTHRAIEHEAIGNAKNFSKFIGSSGIKRQDYRDEKFEGYYNPETHEEYTYADYAVNGEENGISADKWHQSFSKSFIGAKDLIEAGAILEDAQWPHSPNFPDTLDQADGRFVNHFYDAQEGGRTSDMRIINILESVL